MKRAAILLAAGAVWAPAVGSSGASAAEGVRVEMTVSDPAVSAETVATPAAVADPALRAFAEALAETLRRRLGESGARPAVAEARLARIPLTASGDAPFPAPPPPPDPEGADCTVVSPWLTLSLRREGGGLTLDLLALWNERQILRDLAALDAEAPPPDTSDTPEAPQTDTPLSRSAFTALAQAWADETLMGAPPPEGAAPLEARVAPELAWLFAQAPQSTRGPFDLGAEGALRELTVRLAPDYAGLAGALIDRCLAPGGEGGRFGGPHDIRTLGGPDFAAAVRD